jgi:hypothetical protein
MTNVVDQFKKDLAEVCWKDLRIHLQHGGIIIVDEGLELIDVAVAVAEDRKPQVETWIAEGALTKPDSEQIEVWETELEKPFRLLIVQPFILIQATTHA